MHACKATMVKARVGDIMVNYEVVGEGEPLLLIGGGGDDLTSWAFQIPTFAQHFTTIAFDNRGAGETDKPVGPYTTAQMAVDAHGLLDVLEVDRAHVLGVSMGGMIAQEFAIAYPERVNKLVLACTCSEPSEANMRFFKFREAAAPRLGLSLLG